MHLQKIYKDTYPWMYKMFIHTYMRPGPSQPAPTIPYIHIYNTYNKGAILDMKSSNACEIEVPKGEKSENKTHDP